MLHINVANVIFGDRDRLDYLPDIDFSLPVDEISIRDLIARTVELQITELLDSRVHSNAQAQALLDKQFIGEQTVNEQAKNGKIALERAKLTPDTPINTELEIKRAINAFIAKRFKVFINGRDHTDLDKCVSYREVINVKFMRIMPLIGG